MAGLVVMCAASVVAGIDGESVMVMSDSVSPSFGSDQQSWATDCVFTFNVCKSDTNFHGRNH